MKLNYKINHIGYAVKDINASIKYFQYIGWNLNSEIVDDKDREVKIAFISNNDLSIELIQPIGGGSPINATLINSKYTAVPYHICYEVDSIDEASKELIKESFIIVKKKAPAIAFNNKNVCFLFNANVGLIELVEK